MFLASNFSFEARITQWACASSY